MTELEVFLRTREDLEEKRKKFLRIKHSSTDKAERGLASRNYDQITELIADLDIQIRHLDPDALKPKKSVIRGMGRKRIFLDAVLNNGNAMSDFIGKEDQYSFDNLDPESPIIQWMTEAAAQLTPNQAKVIDLYYNHGYSMTKIAEIMGKRGNNTVSVSIRRALKCIRYWIKIRRVVTVCAMQTPFDWDRFLNEIDVLEKNQLDAFLVLLDSKDNEFTTAYQLWKYVNLRRSGYRELRRLKTRLCAIGIPHEEVDAVHPLLKRAGDPDPEPRLIHQICGAAKLERYPCRKKKEPNYAGS